MTDDDIFLIWNLLNQITDMWPRQNVQREFRNF